jgi:hypothetical protein
MNDFGVSRCIEEQNCGIKVTRQSLVKGGWGQDAPVQMKLNHPFSMEYLWRDPAVTTRYLGEKKN